MIKNNKGFTMVELLAAVTILGILATIAIVSVTNTMEKSHKEYDEKQNKLFTTAAQTYFTDNRSELPKKLLTTNTVTLKKLIEENYIEEIVDYKKKAYDKEKSVATIKKTGAGKYMYYSTLVSEDGKRKVSDAPDTNNNKGNVNITINNPNLASTDMQKSFTESDRIIYYVNKEITIPVNLTGTRGISSYQYRIDKLSTVSSSEGKKYKISGEIAVDKESFNDTITINAKDFANGIYRLSVNAYGYQAEGSTEDASYIIVIDKTKPKCTIEMSREPDGNKVEGDTFGNKWYKAGDLSAKMKITEKNKYKYTLGFDEMQYNIEYKYNNIKEEEILPITQNIINKYVYGYVKDKAGNVGECKTEKPIYYDKTIPICNLEINKDNQGSYNTNTTWYWNDVKIDMSSTDNSDQNESGLYKTALDTTKHSDNYNNYTESFSYDILNPVLTSNRDDKQTNETSGIIWYGHVMDAAGNVGSCNTGDKGNIKVDKNPPTCSASVKSGTAGNKGWYISDTTAWADCSDSISGCQSTRWLTLSGASENCTNKAYTNYREVNATGTSNLYWKVYDNAGHEKSCSQTINVDQKKPSCPKFSPNNSGWTKNTVSVSITNTTSDEGSGVSYWDFYTDYNNDNWQYFTKNSGNQTKDISAEGYRRGRVIIYDYAGLSHTCTTGVYHIDKTAPTLSGFNRPKTSDTSDNCNGHGGTYCCMFNVSDGLSGYRTGSFSWNGGSNNVSRTGNHTEHIGFSTTPINLSYKVCDAAGNCNSGTKSTCS